MLASNNLALVASTNERQITLYELFDEYLDTLTSNSVKQFRYYINDFKKYFEDIYIDEITVNDVQKYINSKISMNLRDTTVYRYYRMLKTIFNYAVSHSYIDKNVCEGVKVKYKLRADTRIVDYSKRYIKKLLKLYKHTSIYYIVLVALHTRHEKN